MIKIFPCKNVFRLLDGKKFMVGVSTIFITRTGLQTINQIGKKSVGFVLIDL
jgi:hypothetical protein